MPITRTTEGSIAANALAAIAGSGLFSSVCRTAASMSFCVSSCAAGRDFAYVSTSPAANSAPATTSSGRSCRCQSRRSAPCGGGAGAATGGASASATRALRDGLELL